MTRERNLNESDWSQNQYDREYGRNQQYDPHENEYQGQYRNEYQPEFENPYSRYEPYRERPQYRQYRPYRERYNQFGNEYNPNMENRQPYNEYEQYERYQPQERYRQPRQYSPYENRYNGEEYGRRTRRAQYGQQMNNQNRNRQAYGPYTEEYRSYEENW